MGGDGGGVFAIADGVSGYAIFAAMNSIYFENRSNELRSAPLVSSLVVWIAFSTLQEIYVAFSNLH